MSHHTFQPTTFRQATKVLASTTQLGGMLCEYPCARSLRRGSAQRNVDPFTFYNDKGRMNRQTIMPKTFYDLGNNV